MQTMPFYVLDSFTRTRFAGNPAGVALPEAPLTEEQMRTLAGEMRLETAFVSPNAGPEADYTVAYYTGTSRVPLCGHDTIALATALAQTGRLTAPARLRLATDVGILTVTVNLDMLVLMDQSLPVYGHTVPADEVADALGLPLPEISESGLPLQVVSTGSPFLIVPVAHRIPFSALAPDWERLIAFGDSLEEYVLGFYVWTPETESQDTQVHARCFCPAAGLPEDPVTGSASGAVGAYLARHGQLTPDSEGVLRLRTEQGSEMGRPGNVGIRLETAGNQVTKVQISGYATLVSEGRVWL